MIWHLPMVACISQKAVKYSHIIVNVIDDLRRNFVLGV